MSTFDVKRNSAGNPYAWTKLTTLDETAQMTKEKVSGKGDLETIVVKVTKERIYEVVKGDLVLASFADFDEAVNFCLQARKTQVQQ